MPQVKEFLSTIMLPAVSGGATQQSQSTQAPVATPVPCSASRQKVVLFAHHKAVMNLLQIMLEEHFHVPKKDSPGPSLTPPASLTYSYCRTESSFCWATCMEQFSSSALSSA